MTSLLRVIGHKALSLLRCEPVAVWGVVLAALLGVLGSLGVSADIIATIGAVASLVGIVPVRGAVTPVQALIALLNGLKGQTAGAGMLGRHVRHDPKSRLYPATTGVEVKSVRWQRRSPIFDQGNVGSCTGNAAAGWVATDTATRKGRADITEADALKVYSKATRLDRIKGVYPPTDTGSSGLAAAKALKALGLATGTYRHAFGLDHALQALQSGPVLVGIEWLTGCDRPDKAGVVNYTGSVRGGHEILADEVDTARKLVGFQNSWGTSYGQSGRFYMTWADFAKALAAQGDVTVPS
ncbi:MAG: hypothetical protein ACXV5Q_01430 [Frankiaceae bacterium]